MRATTIVTAARSALLAAAGLCLATPAFAETGGGRYQLQAVEGGVVRLDTATGQMDFCRTTGAGLACELAAPAPARTAPAPTKLDPQTLQQSLRDGSATVEAVMPELISTMLRLRQSMDREMARQPQQ